MSELRTSIEPLIASNRGIDNHRQHQNILQVQILKLKLKEEKLRDKIVYQSLKDKIVTH